MGRMTNQEKEILEAFEARFGRTSEGLSNGIPWFQDLDELLRENRDRIKNARHRKEIKTHWWRAHHIAKRIAANEGCYDILVFSYGTHPVMRIPWYRIIARSGLDGRKRSDVWAGKKRFNYRIRCFYAYVTQDGGIVIEEEES